MKKRLAVLVGILGLCFCGLRQGLAQWAQAPGPSECYVKALAVAGPRIFALVRQAGVFMSEDGGAHWTAAKTAFPPGQAVSCLQEIGGRIFAGASSKSEIACFSTDRGVSWKRIVSRLPAGGDIRRVNSFALLGTDLFIGRGDDGLLVCRDLEHGAEAVRVSLPGSPSVRALAAVGADLYAAGDRGALFRVWKSGPGWAVTKLKFPKHNWPTCLAEVGSDLFAGASGGVFRSSDQGASWTNAATHLPEDADVVFLAADGPDLLAVLDYPYDSSGPAAVRLSREGGQKWKMTLLGLKKTNINCFASSEAGLLAGASDGVHLSLDRGASWARAYAGLPAVSTVDYLAAVGTDLFAATSHGNWSKDHGHLYVSRDAGGTWTPVGSEFPDHSAAPCLAVIGPDLFAGLRFRRDPEKWKAVYLSRDSGRTWVPATAGLPGAASVSSLAVLGQSLYARTNEGIYVSDDHGTSWAACNGGLPRMGFGVGISCLAAGGEGVFLGIEVPGPILWGQPAPPLLLSLLAGGQKLFAGASPPAGRLHFLPKGGKKWQDTHFRFSMWIRCMAVAGDRLFIGNDNGLYVHDYRAGTGKPSKIEGLWTSVSCLAVSGKRLIMGGSRGVYIVTDDGDHWSYADTGFPSHGPTILCLMMTGSGLLVGTDERGLWRLPLADLDKLLQ